MVRHGRSGAGGGAKVKPAKARFSEGVCNGVPKENKPRVSGRKGSSIRRVGFLSLLKIA